MSQLAQRVEQAKVKTRVQENFDEALSHGAKRGGDLTLE